jgi:hypothetical protein
MSTHDVHAVLEEPERLTWSEIHSRYPDEWVVVVDVDWDEEVNFHLTAALVLGHFKHRKEASPFIKATFQDHEDVSCFWTGKKIRGPVPRFVIP